MIRRWKVNCPYCHAEIASGSGYGDKLPDIYVPFIRCRICGQLFLTGKNEYLTTPVEKRTNFIDSESNDQQITESLDRTLNEEYIEILKQHGFKIYPITDEDIATFVYVNFGEYEHRKPSATATQTLYDAGILIKAEEKDINTGGVKKEILQENQKQYNRNRKNEKWSAIVGLVVGIFFTFLFGSINPNSYLFVLGIVLGFISAFITSFCMNQYYKKQDTNKEQNRQNNNVVHEQTTQHDSPKVSREQRWKHQQEIDDEILNNGSDFSEQMLAAATTINALWNSVSYFANSKNTQNNSELFLRALTAEMFLKNYYIFQDGNRENIKDHIYKDYPYIVHDALIGMGLYIFETKNNLHVLEYIINSDEAEFQSSKLKAKQIFEQEKLNN